ncbi:hypothetical protein LQV63_04350 [Paenibacillus profundus]|uniref:Secreted protein n=1 Tax=Paenibacillus profundus TaxID=1173085 RepID=A0ABS8Y9K2_9BACL|nr:hypothetical protein [Paenibacillus profundus]MCE5168543.1 hypothetical protein [Paenibacillus profundus]
MSKLIKFTGILMSASFILLSFPSQTEAAKCDSKYIAKTETFCDHSTGYTITNTYYKQTCYSDKGQPHTYEWVDSKKVSGCIN